MQPNNSCSFGLKNSVKENDHLAEQSRIESGQKEIEAPDKKMCFEKSFGCWKNIPSPGPFD